MRYTVDDLERLVDVSARTIRYYTGIGLLPPPDERGRFAYYSADHLQRLRLIKRLKDVDLHLGTIKRYVDTMTIDQIEALLQGPLPSPSPLPSAPAGPAAAHARAPARQRGSDDAAAYIARVLAGQREAKETQDWLVLEEWATAGAGVAVACRSCVSLASRWPASTRAM